MERFGLTGNQEKCIKLMMTTDLNQKQIADEIGVHPNTVSIWVNDDKFIKAKQHIDMRLLRNATSKAIDTVIDLLDSDQDQVRLNAAKDIMDRTGFKPIDRVEHKGEINKGNPFEDLTSDELRKYLDKLEGD